MTLTFQKLLSAQLFMKHLIILFTANVLYNTNKRSTVEKIERLLNRYETAITKVT